MKSAIFKMLRKRDKDPTVAENFHPISMLSAFYKIVSCVIKNRIKKVIPLIISKQQRAHVPDDNIGSVLINLISIMCRNIFHKK